ncbi:hypothetical protein [Streptomyces corynorhini]|uniref:HEPN domain-containing protein n=1 Tax=Streptomyces corynorhini TaxID=2282652 RepID=A0A370BD48_9ACTN|nr:hypothetical protein [Streptomyces corynorhini]RDG38582.1 hypothetical protein DVH02_08320 [Streptomyces corynorhini]
MVNVNVRQLLRSQERLLRRGDEAEKGGDRTTAGLLLFYSAECGLKAGILRRRKARDTSQLPERTHDLRDLAKELRLPVSVQAAVMACKRREKDTSVPGADQPVAAKDLHQAWRYGADLDPGEEQQALVALRHLIEAARTCP